MRAILVLHGHGAAWFDDVQVEEGPGATPYQPSPADAAEQARRAAEAQAAAAWIAALPPRLPGQARIAILDEAFPAGDCRPSDPAVLAKALQRRGLRVHPHIRGDSSAMRAISTRPNSSCW